MNTKPFAMMSPLVSRGILRALAMCVALDAALLLGGCASPPPPAPAQVKDASVDMAALFGKGEQQAPVDPHAGTVPAHLNSPRAAAQELAIRGAAIDRKQTRDVRLCAALFRAAINADQASHSGYLLVAGEDAAAFAGDMSPREFRLRVLAAMTGLTMPVAWDSPNLAWMLDERAPGGPAAHAWFEIVSRDDAMATVQADVCVESAKRGTRKYRVEAIYDGRAWTIRDLGARTVW